MQTSADGTNRPPSRRLPPAWIPQRSRRPGHGRRPAGLRRLAQRARPLRAIRSAGAYGMVMASSYNGRPLPAEVLCDGDQAHLIRKRDDLEDLWRGEFRLQS